MKTAKVTDVGNVRKWSGPQGDIYYHNIVLDNGDRGSIGKKSAGAIQAGETLTYTIDGDKIKAVMVNNGGRPTGRQFGGSKTSTSAMALAYAKDIAVAYIAKSDTPIEKMDATADRILAVADKFDKWIKERE